MKNYQKYTALLLCGGLGILTACSQGGNEKKDPSAMAASAIEALASQSSVTMTADTNIELTMKDHVNGDVKASASQKLTLTHVSAADIWHVTGSYAQNYGDTDLESSMDIYQINESGQTVCYTNYEGIWMQTQDTYPATQVADSILQAVADGCETASVHGKNQVKASISVSQLGDILYTGEGVLGALPSDDTSAQVDAVIEFDKKTGLPSSMTIDLRDAGNDLMETLENGTGEFSQYTMEIEYTEFGTVSDMTLPEEAKNSVSLPDISGGDISGENGGIAEHSTGNGGTDSGETTGYNSPAKVDENGAYMIEAENAHASAAIGLPEGFDVNVSSTYYLGAGTADYVNLDYTFVEFYSADTMASEYETMMAYIKDNPEYTDVSFSEEKKMTVGDQEVSYVCLTYVSPLGTDTAQYMTWVQTGDVIFTCQISNLAGEDDEMVRKVYEEISFSY